MGEEGKGKGREEVWMKGEESGGRSVEVQAEGWREEKVQMKVETLQTQTGLLNNLTHF